MIQINIISATPGISTHEQILQLVRAKATGITVKQMSKSLNRPISMIQVCLKDLLADKVVLARKNKVGVGLIYYPK